MASNDTIQLAVQGTVGSQRHVHTLHFRLVQPTLIEDALAADYRDNVLTAYRAIFSSTDTPAELIVARQVCGTVPLRAPAEVTPASAAGTRNTAGMDRLPSYVAAVVSERTASAGRSRRGRFFIGGLVEFDADFNTLRTGGADVNAGNAIIAYVAALARYLSGGAQQANYRLVVHSRKLASVPGTQCQDSSTFTTGYIVRTALGSMRSRKAGHGT